MSNLMRLPDAYKELYEPEYTGRKYSYKVFYGGRDSCKSHSFARALLSLGKEKKLNILCLREFYSSIKDSVKSLLDNVINEYNLEYFYYSIDNEIRGLNGTKFIFGGLKTNNQNIKGKEKINIVWCEEAESISERSWQILIPTIVRNKDFEIWVSFNPEKETDPVYQRFVIEKRDDVLVRKVSWRDNPYRTSATLREMIGDKKRDIETYNWVWEGDFKTVSDAIVFKGKYRVATFDTPDDAFFYYGLDFGWNDPIAIIRCFVDHEDKRIYIDKAAKINKLTNDKIAEFIRQNIPEMVHQRIYADSARPETIEYLKQNGLPRIVGTKKTGKLPVLERIEWLKTYETVIHSKLKDVELEFSLYSYVTDERSGLPDYTKFVDKDNHYIDAYGYATENVRKSKYTFTIA